MSEVNLWKSLELIKVIYAKSTQEVEKRQQWTAILYYVNIAILEPKLILSQLNTAFKIGVLSRKFQSCKFLYELQSIFLRYKGRNTLSLHMYLLLLPMRIINPRYVLFTNLKL